MTDASGDINYEIFATGIGPCGVAWRGVQIVAATLPEATDDETAARLARRCGGSRAAHLPAWVRGVIDDVTSLMADGTKDLTHIPCDLAGLDPFRISVYELTRAVPPGETTTYGEIAEKLGNKRFAQAVGQAMGANPIPIIIPCHRVMGANGKLTGFSANGGVATKLRLLDLERARLGGNDSLFGHLPLAMKPGRNVPGR
ncbi:MAG: methylated-DNA--[protein]-cysteine S-methyltransferase [Hyphomicrobiaceae bacterium]